jgi:hypothetical protein
MSKKRQRKMRTERERLRARVGWMHQRNSELRCANHALRRTNAHLQVALDASDVLLGAAMDELLEKKAA